MPSLSKIEQFDCGPANGRNRRVLADNAVSRFGGSCPDRTLAFLWLLRFCRPAVCDADLHIPDEMVPGAVTLTGWHDLINLIDARAEAKGGQPRGAAAWSSR
jgi:hypothetical protein